MSKRFGRNQKRKLKYEAQKYKDALELQNKLTRHLRSVHEHDADTLKRVKEVLGECTALLDPQIKIVETSPGARSVEMARMTKNQSVYAYPDDQAAVDYTLNRDVLYLLNFVKLDDKINLATHFEFRYKDGKVGYAISEVAMKELPTDILIQQISQEMAKMLVQSFKENKV